MSVNIKYVTSSYDVTRHEHASSFVIFVSNVNIMHPSMYEFLTNFGIFLRL
jgi:hypothetical protein